MTDPISAFRQVLESNGLRPGEINPDGKLHRCPTEAKPNGKDGGYSFHPDPPASGYFKNWRTGADGTWTAERSENWTSEEKERFRLRVQEERKRRQDEEAQRHAEAREKAAHILAEAPDCPADHPYLVRKGVPVHPGLKLGRDGRLIVPVLGQDGQPMSLQFIAPDGSKKFLTGGKTAGGFFAIRGVDGPLYVAEGYATAATVHAATGFTTLAAFNAGNLKAVAQGARKLYPNRALVLCADDDAKTEGNPGITKATEAARAVGGIMIAPRFSDPDHAGSDFNDLAGAEGLEAVKAQLAGTMPAMAEDAPMDEPPPWLDDVPPPDDQAAPDGPPQAPPPEPAGFFAEMKLDEIQARRFLDEPPSSLRWTLTGSLLDRTVGFVCGAPGTGKSTLLLQLAGQTATGEPLFGDDLKPGIKGRVLAVFAEEDERILHRRTRRVYTGAIQGQPGEWSQAEADFASNLHLVPAAGQDLRFIDTAGGTARASGAFMDFLALAQKMEGLALIVLDPLSRFYGGAENDNATANLFCSLLERITAETGATVIVCHHTGKGAALGADKKFSLDAALHQDAMRGASALTGAARWQLNLVTLPAKDARGIIGATEAGPGQYLAAKVAKKNYGPPEDAFFLRRGEGGVLVPVEARRTAEDRDLQARLVERIAAEVRAREKGGMDPLTMKTLADVFPSRWKEEIPGASKTAVRSAAEAAVLDGALFKVRRFNSGNRRQVEYLASHPATKPDAGQGVGDTGQDTGQKDTGHAGQHRTETAVRCEKSMIPGQLDTGQKDTGRKPLSGVKVQSFQTPDTGQEFPPKGGREGPSGVPSLPSLGVAPEPLPHGGNTQEEHPDEVTI
jgi:phage/plasmid primase-like uncharacterized protein/RecA-family ATPase